jgi:hypothetical protein
VDFRKKIKKFLKIKRNFRKFRKKKNFFNTLELSVNFRKTLELFRKTTEYFRKHCYSKRYSNRYRKFEKFPKISGRKISGNERKFPEIFVPEQFGIVHSETFGNLRKCSENFGNFRKFPEKHVKSMEISEIYVNFCGFPWKLT